MSQGKVDLQGLDNIGQEANVQIDKAKSVIITAAGVSIEKAKDAVSDAKTAAIDKANELTSAAKQTAIDKANELTSAAKTAAVNKANEVKAEAKAVLIEKAGDIRAKAEDLQQRGQDLILSKANDVKAKGKEALQDIGGALTDKTKTALLNGLGLQLTKPKTYDPNTTNPQPTTTAPVTADTSRKGWFGTPVFSNLEFPSGAYETLDGETIQFKGIRIDAALFVVNQARNIIKTPIQGENGTVKQYISDGDFEIECSGVIVGSSTENGSNFTVAPTFEVPEEELRKFLKILSIPKEIEVTSQFLDFFDITTVVVESYSFQQMQGSQDTVMFAVRMLSDTPLELR
jgi:hypothetical protein